ncbi:DMT family transporter [uncultured Kordia sp.]|uniref:DMT family transporter n=1 Tax=uncultured Kordia sp. TaxID=507699 RepID=UPI00261B9BC2|nr:DMT family transporter [uncultured Kordia sp.]
MDNAKLKWIYLLILSLIWGSSFILIKHSLEGLTPTQVGALRIVITALFLFPVGLKSLKKLKREHWKWVLWTGLLGSFFPPFLFAIAQTELDSSIASMLNSLTPLNTVVFGILFFGVLVTKRQALGVFVGLIGALLLITAGADFNPDQNYWMSILIIISTIGYGLNVNMIKRYLNDVDALAIATGNFIIIVIPAVIILAWTGFFSTIGNDLKMQEALLYVCVLSLFGTAIAKVLFNRLVQVASPVFASSVTYTMPVIAIFWGLFFGERLSMYQILGGIIILFGVYLVNKRAKKTAV